MRALAVAMLIVSAGATSLFSVTAAGASQQEGRMDHIIAQLIAEPTDQQQSELENLIQRALVRTFEERDEESTLIALGSSSPSEFGGKEDLDALLAKINARIPVEVDRSYLRRLHGFSSPEEMAQTWAAPLPEPMDALSKEQLVALLDAFNALAGDLRTERITWFVSQSTGPEFGIDLIYWPYADWTNEELADEIFKRRAIVDEGGGDALKAYELEVARRVIADPDAKPYSQMWAEGRLKAFESDQTGDATNAPSID